ncbi:MAG: thymidine kinase [Candidatus Nanohaloarchaea archaeon]
MSPEFHFSGGSIEVITGCMFSGKTEEMLKRVERAEMAGRDVAVFIPETDDRYGEEKVGSHSGREWSAEVVSPEQPNIETGADVVAVDEANFFQGSLVEECQRLASEGKRVIVSGIDSTFRGEPFEPVPELMSVAEYVDKLRAVCAVCGKPASRNQRIVDGEPAHVDDPTVVVGADEKYEPRCRNCHEVRR